ncbi:winged helix-turn-helix domain-containing protein [Ascidiaceihabitans sp.]|uniref:winged helix-turn-helix domain-containing tetratricopeptide repeat protein n=1 Tax=Ascidiaceihabitans sp. TaxID=1872644 RepID=UPI0032995236
MMDKDPSHIVLSLGDATYERQSGKLRDVNGVEITLRPQSAATLKLLASHVGETVTKDALIDEVWSGLSVTDDSIVQCIADIRRNIGDKTRQILRTVPKKGYCLSALEKEVAVAALASAPHAQHDTVASVLAFARHVGATLHIACATADNATVFHADMAQFAAGQGLTIATKGLDWIEIACESAMAASAFALLAVASRPLRIGIDMGFPQDTPPHRARHLAALAHAGDIMISGEVTQFLTAGLDCDILDVGDCVLPDIEERTRCYKIFDRTQTPGTASVVNREDLLPTIAVIPFKARNPDPQAAVLGEVLAEDVISLLSRSLEINVISRLSSTKFAQRDASLAEIGKLLGTNYVLSGRHMARGGKLEVHAELAEVSTGRILWADAETCDVDQSYSAPDIIEWIVARVQKAIYTRAVMQVRQQPLPTLESYTLLMSAVALMHRLSPDDFFKAKVLLEALMERAPNQAAPIAWMARWHVLRVQQGQSPDPGTEAEPALDLTKRALDLDPDNVLALVSEGMVLTNLKRQLHDAEERYNRALDISPNDAVGRLLRGTMFAFRGEGQDAIRDTEHSLRLTPLDPLKFFFLSLTATAYLTAGQNEKALELAELSLRANSTHTSTLRVKGVAQMRLNRVKEARETGVKLMKLQPNLRVSDWLRLSPTRDYAWGQELGNTMKDIGIPE